MDELKKYTTAQLVEELSSRDGVGIYNCDKYRHDNYDVILSKRFGDMAHITPPSFADVIIINRKQAHPDNDGK